MKIKYEKQPTIIFIIAVLLFFMCMECDGQVKRVKRYNLRQDITTIVPDKPMKFGHIDNDTVYVSISADSSYLGYEFRVFMFMPKFKNVGEYELEIGLEGHRTVILSSGYIISELNYVEFILEKWNVQDLKTRKIEYISFNKDGKREICNGVRTRAFFCNFLQLYKY